MPNLRILFIIDSVFPITKGGSEIRVDKIARYCERRGCAVEVLCGKWWAGNAKQGFLTGLPVAGSLRSGKLGFVEAASFAGSLSLALGKVESSYDIVEFSQTPVLHLGLVDLVRRSKLGRGASMLCQINEVWSAGYWMGYAGLAGGLLGFGIERYALGRFDHVTTVSEFNRSSLVSRGLDPDRVSVIRSGVDFEAISEAVQGPKTFDVVFVGRLVREKGVRMLVELIPQLEARLGRRVRVAVGGVGPERESMRRRSEELGVADRVDFLGRIETQRELYSLLKSSKVFVYPAAPEGGWSLAMVEANAAGLPTVSARANEIGTATEVIREGVNGIIVRSFRAELFAEALARILGDDSELSSLSKTSTDSAKRYDWEKIGSSALDLYLRLADSGTRTGRG